MVCLHSWAAGEAAAERAEHQRAGVRFSREGGSRLPLPNSAACTGQCEACSKIARARVHSSKLSVRLSQH
jgi:hypothetical protein